MSYKSRVLTLSLGACLLLHTPVQSQDTKTQHLYLNGQTYTTHRIGKDVVSWFDSSGHSGTVLVWPLDDMTTTHQHKGDTYGEDRMDRMYRMDGTQDWD